MIFILHKNKNLSCYSSTPIYIGENNFDKIQVIIPPIIDENDTEDLNFYIHLCNKDGEYARLPLTVESSENKKVGSTVVTADLTAKEQIFDVYIEMTTVSGEKVGKTNVKQVHVFPLPDEKDRIIPPSQKQELEEEIQALSSRVDSVVNSKVTEISDESTDNEVPSAKAVYDFVSESSGEKNYNVLENKPQINNVPLQGNKTSDELGLQKKLIAGENITLDESGNISANGGTDDYNDLENKPKINGHTLSGDKTSSEIGVQSPISIELSNFNHGDINQYVELLNGFKIAFNTQYLFTNHANNRLPDRSYSNGINGYCLIANQYDLSLYTKGINGKIPVNEFGTYFRFSGTGTECYNYYLTESGVLYFQKATMPQGQWVVGGWTKIGAGARIVSGTVGNNGHITFTDSDGNTFTTTGESVIGANGVSATHSWDGTVLTITSASGSSSADLKGASGNDGRDWVPTEQELNDIAQRALNYLPDAENEVF